MVGGWNRNRARGGSIGVVTGRLLTVAVVLRDAGGIGDGMSNVGLLHCA